MSNKREEKKKDFIRQKKISRYLNLLQNHIKRKCFKMVLYNEVYEPKLIDSHDNWIFYIIVRAAT